MAFGLQSMSRMSSSGNASGQSHYSYTSSDALATVIASDYFDGFSSSLKQHDLIHCQLSDARGTLRVTSTDASTTPTVAGYGEFESNVNVTNAECLALVTPKTLVAAPGAGLTLLFKGAVVHHNFVTGAFAEASAPDDPAIRYTDGSGLIVSDTVDAGGLVVQSADSMGLFYPIPAASGLATTMENQALVLDNTGSNWTSGGGNLDVTIKYEIVAASFT